MSLEHIKLIIPSWFYPNDPKSYEINFKDTKKNYRKKNLKTPRKEKCREQIEAAIKKFKENNPNYHKNYRQKNKEKIKKYTKERYKKNGARILQQQKNYYKKNRNEILERGKIHYQKNKEKERERQKLYRKNNKDKVKFRIKRCELKNREKYNIQRKNYIKKRRKNDVEFRLKLVMRVLNKIGLKKEQKTCFILGYSPEKLKKRLEMNFTCKMTWKNYGEYWQIDHKIPVSYFIKKGVKNPRLINALSNLQPLTCKDNLLKSNKFKKL